MERHRIKAFTLMELTIAMLISAVVIGITYTGYTMVSRMYGGFTAKHEDMAVMLRLDELFKRDFSRAESIALTAEDTYTFKDSSRTITYRFTPEYIVRNGLAADTFRVSCGKPKAYFESNPVEESAEPTADTDHALIDELSFQLAYKGELFPCHYSKTYSSENLINRKPAYALH